LPILARLVFFGKKTMSLLVLSKNLNDYKSHFKVFIFFLFFAVFASDALSLVSISVSKTVYILVDLLCVSSPEVNTPSIFLRILFGIVFSSLNKSKNS
jgi:hypothetical protein